VFFEICPGITRAGLHWNALVKRFPHVNVVRTKKSLQIKKGKLGSTHCRFLHRFTALFPTHDQRQQLIDVKPELKFNVGNGSVGAGCALDAVAYAENFRGGAKHRRSQGGQKAMPPQTFLENIVILCFETRIFKQSSVIRLKLKILVHTAEYWQYTLPNTVYTFFIFRVWGKGHGTVPPSVR